MSRFIVTTNKETANAVESVAKNDILMYGRSLKLKGVNHNSGYSTICFESTQENGKILPEDIFFIGLHAGLDRTTANLMNEPEF